MSSESCLRHQSGCCRHQSSETSRRKIHVHWTNFHRDGTLWYLTFAGTRLIGRPSDPLDKNRALGGSRKQFRITGENYQKSPGREAYGMSCEPEIGGRALPENLVRFPSPGLGGRSEHLQNV